MLSSWYKDYLQTECHYVNCQKGQRISVLRQEAFSEARTSKILHPEGPERSLSVKWAEKTGPQQKLQLTYDRRLLK